MRRKIITTMSLFIATVFEPTLGLTQNAQYSNLTPQGAVSPTRHPNYYRAIIEADWDELKVSLISAKDDNELRRLLGRFLNDWRHVSYGSDGTHPIHLARAVYNSLPTTQMPIRMNWVGESEKEKAPAKDITQWLKEKRRDHQHRLNSIAQTARLNELKGSLKGVSFIRGFGALTVVMGAAGFGSGDVQASEVYSSKTESGLATNPITTAGATSNVFVQKNLGASRFKRPTETEVKYGSGR